MDETFPLALDAFREKQTLTPKDKAQLNEILDHLDEITDRVIDAEGDDKMPGEYYDMMIEFENILHPGQKTDVQKQEESYQTSVSDEVKRKRIVKQPGPELKEQVNRANIYYERTKKTRSEINELKMKANKAMSSRELNEINVQLNVLHSQQSLQDSVAKGKYADILKENPNNIQANYAMSEILRREGKHWVAQTARARAMLHATPEVRKEMNENEKRKFLKALQIHDPTKESSFIKSMKADFRAEYVEPIEAEQEDKDTIEQSTIISKVLEWAWEKAKPLRTDV